MSKLHEAEHHLLRVLWCPASGDKARYQCSCGHDGPWCRGVPSGMCTDKESANVGRIHGRFDLEIVIAVAPQDRQAINDEFLVDMKRAMRERTGLLAPVIYLDGYEPPIVREYDSYF
jgi:hypothetical protein